MKHLSLTKKIMAVALLSLALSTEANAADTFVSFEPTAGAWQLSDITIGLAEGEHSCVTIAAANLATDFEKVTGTKASIISPSSFLLPRKSLSAPSASTSRSTSG